MTEALGFFIVAIVSMFIGFVTGLAMTSSASRDAFLKYCTQHGDTFEVCDKIWRER